jgi:pimeloyl-ACP methyl ester carboxylesterase
MKEEPLFKDGRSRAVAWPGVCHWPHQERPDEFNALVEAWFEEAGPGPT